MMTLNILIMSYMEVLKKPDSGNLTGNHTKIRGHWRVTYETHRQAPTHLRNFEGYIHIKTLNIVINPRA